MKRLLLISLAVLLAVSLGITMFPTQSVAALQKGGLAFHIKAKGEGDYLYQYPGSESGTGEFSINVAGNKRFNYQFSRGRWRWGLQDVIQGHIKGSFGEHEIDVTLTNPWSLGEQVWLDDETGKITAVGFKFKGTYDGNKVTSVQSYIRVYYENGELDYILADLCFIDGANNQTFLDVTMYDASVDLHQNPN